MKTRTDLSASAGSTTRLSRRLRAPQGILLLGLSLMSSACGPELDPISRVETLRVIGVRKSAPYARPGEQVDMQLLWEDGRQGPTPEVDTFFAFWCVNPTGGNFGQCLREPPKSEADTQYVGGSTEFSFRIPEDSLRPSMTDPSLPASGMAVVFYGVCSGTLEGAIVSNGTINQDVLENAVDGQALIPRCVDEDGNDLGPDDFVLGYSTVLVYEEFRNDNPLITGFQVDGEDVLVDCIDEACDAPMPVPDLDGCIDGVACLEACEDDGDFFLCPETKITALIDENSAEIDSYSEAAYGRSNLESIWVSYFVDRGNVSPPLRLVNDAEKGWQGDFSSSVYAPKDPGPLRIWAAVRDNRGGISWARLPAYVRK